MCGGGAAGSGCCDYQTVMNALLMRSEQLGSASASVGRMTATVRLTPPHPDRHPDLLRPPGCFFPLVYDALHPPLSHEQVRVRIHTTPVLMPRPNYYAATATLHVLFINDRGRELG